MKEVCYWAFCFAPPSGSPPNKIFGFSEFLAAVALLAIVYTITDVRYKFRIAVAPGPLYKSTFAVMTIIGLQTLLTEVWINEKWWTLSPTWLTLSIWQGIFGLLFLGTFLTWMYYAFLYPAIFGKRNAERYRMELYRYILRGDEDELKIIAHEVALSAKSLVAKSYCIPNPYHDVNKPLITTSNVTETGKHAGSILLLIANRKFCRQIVGASPVTAQEIFNAMSNTKVFNIPIGHFARNITIEAIAHGESFLYEEAEGFNSGLLGYIKPVSQAVYGDFNLIESLATYSISAFDISPEEQYKWKSTQWEAYYTAFLYTLEDCLTMDLQLQRSLPVSLTFMRIQQAFHDIKNMDELKAYSGDTLHRLVVAANFIEKAVNLISSQKLHPVLSHGVNNRPRLNGILDDVAELIFEIFFTLSCIRKSIGLEENFNRSFLWGSLWGLGKPGAAWKIIRLKVRRLLYDSITFLAKAPNPKDSRILGLCLNELGFTTNKNDRSTHALKKVTISWVKENYLKLRQKSPAIAETVLIGRLSFDEAESRLVLTHSTKIYLDLLRPEDSSHGAIVADEI
ncbi:hypothetical protein FNU76_18785 [Chitinimonas arctica]|uniref:Uncharacterized protein n=1 Tax=Chitinimonas arctica TaxID=2594795 RepID=A0A516SJK6_9NEIS|nr:hypothetical protein [Chitinimonas arctica]QDQ28228.1 hypothetical protein FNU76_18785 [Chitinimonas arctica]